MPRLILINGPPGCGKSTLARIYVDQHPLALNLDIDQLRSAIGQWRENRHAAGLRARAIALAAARVHLAAGHDVVIPQFVGQTGFLHQLETAARDLGARFDEMILIDSKDNALRRFTDRGRQAGDPAALQAHQMAGHRGGSQELSAMYDRLLAIAADRPAARLIPTRAGQIDQAYQDLLASLG